MKKSTSVAWQSPSNIAIVKYWGKHGKQYPRNASISLTLSAAATTTMITSTPADGLRVSYLYQGRDKPEFADRVERILGQWAESELPGLRDLHLEINSYNSFPHSSGIASSASFMSSLALGIVDILSAGGLSPEDAGAMRRVSHLSRLGSGSACRSIYPSVAVWGEHAAYDGSSDDHAIAWADVHAIFETYHDDILIVSSAEKAVSSSAGHALMEGHPYAATRYEQAAVHMQWMRDILRAGDIEAFGEIMENEALTLHGLMMNSPTSYILLEPATLSIISEIRAFRKEKQIPVYFTLDAGPNIHMLYPHSEEARVSDWREEVLRPHYQFAIRDRVGRGAKKLSAHEASQILRPDADFAN